MRRLLAIVAAATLAVFVPVAEASAHDGVHQVGVQFEVNVKQYDGAWAEVEVVDVNHLEHDGSLGEEARQGLTVVEGDHFMSIYVAESSSNPDDEQQVVTCFGACTAHTPPQDLADGAFEDIRLLYNARASEIRAQWFNDGAWNTLDARGQIDCDDTHQCSFTNRNVELTENSDHPQWSGPWTSREVVVHNRNTGNWIDWDDPPVDTSTFLNDSPYHGCVVASYQSIDYRDATCP